MDKTFDILPGEGEVEVIKRVRKRQTCENCGEVAHYKFTFLLPNARSNPASKAFGRDDCSWCEDAHQFSCSDQKCQNEMDHLEGYGQCSRFPAMGCVILAIKKNTSDEGIITITMGKPGINDIRKWLDYPTPESEEPNDDKS